MSVCHEPGCHTIFIVCPKRPLPVLRVPCEDGVALAPCEGGDRRVKTLDSPLSGISPAQNREPRSVEMKLITLAASAVLVVVAVPTSKANTIYDVNVSIVSGTGTATGTITTDGTQGQLNQADIVDWNLLLQITDTSQSFDLLGPGAGASQNSAEELLGTAVSATTAGLFFNFNGSSSDLRFYSGTATAPTNDLCFAGASVPAGCFVSSGITVKVDDSAAASNFGFPGTNFKFGTPRSVPGPVVGAGLQKTA
jgi:hypothetical protein